MAISKEVKAGLIATAAAGILFFGFYFLKGADIFSSKRDYICYYDDVGGLQGSAAVQLHGMNVGNVSGIELKGSRVQVKLSIKKSIAIPKGTIALLAQPDIMGSKVVQLDMGPGPGVLAAGDTLATLKQGGVVDKISGELTPRLAELKVTISEINRAMVGVNSIVGEQNQKALADALASIKVTADNLTVLSGTLSKESGEIAEVVHNAKTFTGGLAKNNDTISRVLANASNITRQLANAPIQRTLSDLQQSIHELHGIVDKINNNQGSLGMLINNKDVYNNLNGSLKSLNALMDDLKAHPSRYINVTVFGKGGGSSKK